MAGEITGLKLAIARLVLGKKAPIPYHIVRLMKKEDIPQVVDIWKETGMQEGNHSVETWFEVDPEAFYVAVTRKGEVLGVCSAVLHPGDIAFVGHYSVRWENRGQGIGRKVWDACYKRIGDRNAAVSAVFGSMELYRTRGGFPILETEYQIDCVETTGDADIKSLLDKVDGIEIRLLTDDELSLALEYDQAIVGYSREKAITLTVHEDDSVSYIALQDGKCVGYGTIKVSVQDFRQVGPLYADSQEIAEVLLRQLIEGLPQAKGLAMMTVSTNEGARNIIEKLRMITTDKVPRLYKNSKFDIDQKKIFGYLNINFSPF